MIEDVYIQFIKDTKMLETNRLTIIPLSYHQLLKYIASDHSLEQELDVHPRTGGISEELADAFENTIIPNMLQYPDKYLFLTLWMGISRQDSSIIGDACFYGLPNEACEVEVGYGMYAGFEGKGYMTELLSAVIGWAANQQELKAIIASTEKTNLASIRVLQKNNFILTHEDDAFFKWKLVLNRT